MSNTSSVTAESSMAKLPGDLAMWVIILAELSVFAILFLVFTVQFALNEDLFKQGQALLDTRAGLIITLALLSASYFVAQAVAFFERNQSRYFALFILAACASALIYVVVKVMEYNHLVAAGFGLSGDKFFTYYFLITGFHLLHVLLGMGILVFVIYRRHHIGLHGVNTAASYWHMVDLVWLVLFPILYLL